MRVPAPLRARPQGLRHTASGMALFKEEFRAAQRLRSTEDIFIPEVRACHAMHAMPCHATQRRVGGPGTHTRLRPPACVPLLKCYSRACLYTCRHACTHAPAHPPARVPAQVVRTTHPPEFAPHGVASNPAPSYVLPATLQRPVARKALGPGHLSQPAILRPNSPQKGAWGRWGRCLWGWELCLRTGAVVVVAAMRRMEVRVALPAHAHT